MINQNAQKRMIWNWRGYFTTKTVAQGESDEREGKIVEFQADPEGHWAKGRTANGFRVTVQNVPTEYEDYLDMPAWDQLKMGYFATGERSFKNYYSCNCSQGDMGVRCRHLASLLYHWERVRGPFVITEDEEKRKARLAREEAERIRAEKESHTVDAEVFLQMHTAQDQPGLVFSLGLALNDLTLTTNRYETELAERILTEEKTLSLSMNPDYDRAGDPLLKINGKIQGETVRMVMQRKKIESFDCSCGRGKFGSIPAFMYAYRKDQQRKLCCHQLVFCILAKTQIQREKPGDETDYKANRLLGLMTEIKKPKKEPETVIETNRIKKPEIRLSPRIVREIGYRESLKLTFDIGLAGGKEYAVRSLDDLIKAVNLESEYQLGKNLHLNFAEQTFQPESEKWADLIASQVKSAQKLTDSFHNQGGFSRYMPTFTVGNSIELGEYELDALYERTEGEKILYQWAGRRDAVLIPVQILLAPILKRLSETLRKTGLAGNAVIKRGVKS